VGQRGVVSSTFCVAAESTLLGSETLHKASKRASRPKIVGEYAFASIAPSVHCAGVKVEDRRSERSSECTVCNNSMQAQACWVCLTNIIIMYLIPTPYVLINPRFPKTMLSIRQNRPD
jgi:hypothetical protein